MGEQKANSLRAFSVRSFPDSSRGIYVFRSAFHFGGPWPPFCL